MKVIFLDVDGELTYSNYQNKKTANIDIKKVQLLKEICDRTGAKVVISSSWRGNDVYTPHIYGVLRGILEDNGIEVIGDTPYIQTVILRDEEEPDIEEYTLEDLSKIRVKYGTGRAAEIQKWLCENEVDSFVILDDEDFNWSDYGYDKYWVQPTWFDDGGLKREHVDKAIEILNNGCIPLWDCLVQAFKHGAVITSDGLSEGEYIFVFRGCAYYEDGGRLGSLSETNEFLSSMEWARESKWFIKGHLSKDSLKDFKTVQEFISSGIRIEF